MKQHQLNETTTAATPSFAAASLSVTTTAASLSVASGCTRTHSHAHTSAQGYALDLKHVGVAALDI